jgi:hypothetical protein
LEIVPVPRHQFGADLMALCCHLVFHCAISQRATAKVLTTVAPYLPGLEHLPCANSIRLWTLRLGLYELQRPKEAADDWVWIMDHTVQLGPRKCLVIVGVRLSDWHRKQGPLEHQDLALLNLTPMQHSNGEAVAAQLEKTRAEMGVLPAAVLSDEGAELKSGMALFRQKSPDRKDVPHVLDIKHKVATLLKKELHCDEAWNAFVKQTNRTKLQVTLTELAFLVPPGLKNKARYMNLDTLVHWGQRALAYLEEPRDFPGQKVDPKRLRKKLGWLERYRPSLAQWAELLEIASLAETYVRREGYHAHAADELDRRLLPVAKTAAGLRLKTSLYEFLMEQGKKSPPGQRLLGSSEVIESLLGKYKQIQGAHSAGGMTASLLDIGTAVMNTTAETIKTAMASVSVGAVGKWVIANLGVTIPAQQAMAFQQNKTSTKLLPAP